MLYEDEEKEEDDDTEEEPVDGRKRLLEDPWNWLLPVLPVVCLQLSGTCPKPKGCLACPRTVSEDPLEGACLRTLPPWGLREERGRESATTTLGPLSWVPSPAGMYSAPLFSRLKTWPLFSHWITCLHGVEELSCPSPWLCPWVCVATWACPELNGMNAKHATKIENILAPTTAHLPENQTKKQQPKSNKNKLTKKYLPSPPENQT